MASKDKTRARINGAYCALERLAIAGGSAAYELFCEATTHALEGEVKHRRMGRGIRDSYLQSAMTSARYFVVSKYARAAEHYPRGATTDEEIALHYATLRRDVLCCTGLRTLVPMPQGFDGLLDLEYARDIVGSE